MSTENLSPTCVWSQQGLNRPVKWLKAQHLDNKSFKWTELSLNSNPSVVTCTSHSLLSQRKTTWSANDRVKIGPRRQPWSSQEILRRTQFSYNHMISSGCVSVWKFISEKLGGSSVGMPYVSLYEVDTFIAHRWQSHFNVWFIEHTNGRLNAHYKKETQAC